MTRMPIEPDVKDWTWVLAEACEECGFDAATADPTGVADAIRANAAGWEGVLASHDAAVRPAANIWSPLEYACHVRDVHRLFNERVHLMLDQDDPQFANWDQDATAIEDDYLSQDPAVVLTDLQAAAEAVAATYDGVAGDQWQRPGRRSNGSVFTVDTIARYHLHDVVHHLVDVHG
jgi:DinB superfamily